ncbi:MAG: PorT family protein [Bacteroides sp.]|nr:PorT family protein [Bacteroides sp.]
MEDKWLDDIKNKLSDYKMEVPEGLWEKVDPSLDGSKSAVKPAYRLRFYRYAAAIAVIMIISGVVSNMWHKDENLDLRAYVPEYNDINNEIVEEAFVDSGIMEINNNGSSGGGNIIRRIAQVGKGKNVADYKREETDEAYPDTVNDEIIDLDNCHDSGLDSERIDSGNDNDRNDIKLSLRSGDGDVNIMAAARTTIIRKVPKTYSDKLALGVMTSAGAYSQSSYYDSGNSNIGNGVIPPNLNDPIGDDPTPTTPGDDDEPLPTTPSDDNGDWDNSNNYGNGDDENGDDSTPEDKKLPLKKALYPYDNEASQNDETTQYREDYSHHMPIKIGVTFLYHLSKSVGIETGLVYTYLSSDVKYVPTENSLFSSGEQSLHYIGIPVNLKYRPLSWKWFNLYLSGGLEVDKCVSGSTKRYYAKIKPNGATSTVFNITERPVQFSINGSVGFQINLNNFLGIYLEPGISYYFKDGSSLNTIYKKHPCDFNLNVGFRFNLGGK